MPKRYTKTHFQKDLVKLSNLIENYNAKGGDNDEEMVEKKKESIYRTFKVVEENGKVVKPHGEYRIKKEQKVGPQKAAYKALGMMCRKARMESGKWEECDGLTVKIQEKTSGSLKKVYGPYVAESVKHPKAFSKKKTEDLRDLRAKKLFDSKKVSSLKKAKEEVRNKKSNYYIKPVTHFLRVTLLSQTKNK